jgi:beta-glucosidase
VAPLFPFGHGLSYSRFDYSDLKIARARDGGLDLSVNIRNAGSVDGDEAPQVYLGAPARAPAGVSFPVRKLIALNRVTLKTGETKTVRFHAPERQLESWSVARHAWVTPPGPRQVSVGASSRDLRLERTIDID